MSVYRHPEVDRRSIEDLLALQERVPTTRDFIYLLLGQLSSNWVIGLVSRIFSRPRLFFSDPAVVIDVHIFRTSNRNRLCFVRHVDFPVLVTHYVRRLKSSPPNRI